MVYTTADRTHLWYYDLAKLTVLAFLFLVLTLLLLRQPIQTELTLSTAPVTVESKIDLVLAGTARPRSSVRVLLNDEQTGLIEVDGSGTWRFPLNAPEQIGTYDVAIQQMWFGVFAGRKEVYDSLLTVQAPMPLKDAVQLRIAPDPVVKPWLFADGSATLNGSASPGSRIKVIIDGRNIASTIVNRAGDWSLPVMIEEPGDYELLVVAVDENDSIIGQFLSTTVVRYAVPTLQIAPDDADTPDEITLFGTATGNTDLAIVVNDESFDMVQVDAEGDWVWVGQLPGSGAREVGVISLTPDGDEVAASRTTTLIIAEPTGTIQVREIAPPIPAISIPQYLADTEEYSLFVSLLDATSNIQPLMDIGPFTVFAPSNEAFGRIPTRILDGWQRNPRALQDILLHHILDGTVTTGILPDNGVLETVGETILLFENEESFAVNGTPVVTADRLLANGVVHRIDNLLLPPTIFLQPMIDSAEIIVNDQPSLSISGTAEPGTIALIEIGRELLEDAIVTPEGTWQIRIPVPAADANIVVWMLDEQDTLLGISEPFFFDAP